MAWVTYRLTKKSPIHIFPAESPRPHDIGDTVSCWCKPDHELASRTVIVKHRELAPSSSPGDLAAGATPATSEQP